MKKLTKNLNRNGFLTYIFLPIFLFFVWLSLTILYVISFDTSFSIWSYNHKQTDFTKLTYNKLQEGDIVTGHFTAKDNNLGIVALRFQTYIRPPYKYEDKFLFRIREKGSSKWYYENKYRSGLIYDVPFFPFGIPKIVNSKGKEYEFEIKSLNGSEINAISVSNRYPTLVTKYKYSKEDLLGNKKVLASFFIKKVYNAMFTPDIWFSSSIYSLPLIFYLFWISWQSRYFNPIKRQSSILISKIKHYKYYKYIAPFVRLFETIFINSFDFVIIFAVLIDVFIIQLTNDVAYAVIILLWIVTLNKYKMNSKNSYIFGLLLLAFPPILLFFGLEPTAEKAAIWAYMFFVAGAIQIILELNSDKKNYEKN